MKRLQHLMLVLVFSVLFIAASSIAPDSAVSAEVDLRDESQTAFDVGKSMAFADGVDVGGGLASLMSVEGGLIAEEADGQPVVEVTTWSRLHELLREDGGNIKLTSDVKFGTAGGAYELDALVVPEGVAVSLDLNGHIIDRGLSEAVEGGSVIDVAGELTIKDSRPDASHSPAFTFEDPLSTSQETVTVTGGIITGGNAVSLYSDGRCYGGGGVLVKRGAHLVMAGGSICNNHAMTTGYNNNGGGGGVAIMPNGVLDMLGTASICGNVSDRDGGGVFMYGATLKMEGNASIVSNNAENDGQFGMGGGVEAQQNSHVSMKGASAISGNKASAYGGGLGLYTASSLSMEDEAAIMFNVADEHGGGVMAHSFIATDMPITMKGQSTISRNSAGWSGGGVYIASAKTVLTMEGDASIAHNYANSDGAGVMAYSGATLNMLGGEIAGNVAGGDGGGVNLGNKSLLNMSGGVIESNAAHGNGGGVYAEPNTVAFTVSGKTVIDGNEVVDEADNHASDSNVYGDAWGGAMAAPITVTGPLTEGASIGITQWGVPDANAPIMPISGFAENNPGADPTVFFKSDSPNCILTVDEDGNVVIYEVVTVTFDGNGHGGVLATMQVPKGKSYNDAAYALSEEDRAALEAKIACELTDGGKTYAVVDYNANPDGSSSEDLASIPLYEDITIYAQWVECVTLVEIAVKPPVCGTATKMVNGLQTNKPVGSIAGTSYGLMGDDESGWYAGWFAAPATSIIAGQEPVEPYIGEFIGGEPYTLAGQVGAASGFRFSKDVVVKVNGVECAVVGSDQYWDPPYIEFVGEVTAVHDLTEAPTAAEVPATCTEGGVAAYWTCACAACGKMFADAAGASEVTAPVATKPLGHAWGKSTYAWSDDLSGCTATHACTREGCAEKESESVKTTGKVTKAATCEAIGTRVHTAMFANSAFATQMKIEVIPAKGHDLVAVPAVAATCGKAGAKAHWECSTCGKLFADAAGTVPIAAPQAVPATGTHSWDAGKVTKDPTTKAKGVRTYTCAVCGTTKTEVIPKLVNGKDGTAVGPGASAATAEYSLTTKAKGESEPQGTVFHLLRAKVKKLTKSAVTLSWTKVKGAKKYVVYGNNCGKNTKRVKVATTAKTSKKFGKVAGKKVKPKTFYKFNVVALDKNNKVISTSKTIHVVTKGGGKYCNEEKVTVAKAVRAKATALKVGKSLKLKAKAVRSAKDAKKKLKLARHRGIAYESSNPKVATVTSKGVVKARKKGSCYVYAYAQDGVFAKIKVLVAS